MSNTPTVSGNAGGQPILREASAAELGGENFTSLYGNRVAALRAWDLGDGNGEQRYLEGVCDGIPGVSATDLTAADTTLAAMPIGSKMMNDGTGEWFVKVHATNSEWRTMQPIVSLDVAGDAAAPTHNYLAIGSLAIYNAHLYVKTVAAGTGTWVVTTD